MPKPFVTLLSTSAKPNVTKDTKNYILSNPLPDRGENGKGIVFITNDQTVYLNKSALLAHGIERADQIRNIHVKIEIEKA